MTDDVLKSSWPVSMVGEAIRALAKASGLSRDAPEPPPPPAEIAQPGEVFPSEALGRWIEATANHLGIGAEPVEAPYSDTARFILGAAPAVLCVTAGDGPRFLALARGGRRRVLALGPDGKTRRVRVDIVRSLLCRSMEAPVIEEVDRLLDGAGVSSNRRSRARAAILRERLAAARVGGCWTLKAAPAISFWKQLRIAGVAHRFGLLLASHAALYLLLLLSWWVIGQGALNGRIDQGWLIAWAMLLLTMVPLRVLTTWLLSLVAIGAGGLLKQRLLFGALKLEPDDIRHEGIGHLLGRVIESEALESLAINGGVFAIFGMIELAMAAAILWAGAAGALHALCLVGWLMVSGCIGWRYYRSRLRWTQARLWMTHDVVEQMVGNRTRLAQESPDRWHDGEDQFLDHYLKLSKEMDGRTPLVIALIPRGWLVVGMAGLVPAFLAGNMSPASLAVSLGGVLFAYRAFRGIAPSILHFTSAAISWRAMLPLSGAAAGKETSGSPIFASGAAARHEGEGVLIEAREIAFRYRDKRRRLLEGCSVRIHTRDRVLLKGRSGCGKSTFAALLTGLRKADSGLLLLGGLDRQTLGMEGWRRRVVAAPQFHENHVFTETFAFNLLMGERWPASPEDLQQAEDICRELGLGDLIERMPAGLQQTVGETGWQLSHGERSRLYIARALLQGADLIVLDESFGSLDAETLQRAMQCAHSRARALLVIAHP